MDHLMDFVNATKSPEQKEIVKKQLRWEHFVWCNERNPDAVEAAKVWDRVNSIKDSKTLKEEFKRATPIMTSYFQMRSDFDQAKSKKARYRLVEGFHNFLNEFTLADQTI